jgi:hypothetical protein
VYITYHDSDLGSTPANPTGDGTTGGWHTDATENVNWMSTKRAHHVTEGTWGTPMAIRGLTGDPGADAIVYYIKPTNGTAIKNGSGTLTIEAHKIVGGSDSILSSGTIKLYDPSNNEITVGNGYAAGSDGYTGVFDEGDISGSIVVTMKDGTGGEALDTITLVDIDDGDDAVVGSIESDIGLVWLQAPGPGDWTPAGTECTLTVKYYQGGVQINTRTVVITRSGATLTAPAPDTVDGITYSRVGNSTSAITIIFEHVASNIQVSETVYAIAGSTSSGGGLSDDVPLLRDITFIGSTGSGKVGWSAGYIDYGGSTYEIVAKAVDDGNTDAWIYWDADDQNTTFKTTTSLATAIAAGNWVVCKNDAGVATPANSHRILLGGLIQVSTLAAINSDLGTVTAGDVSACTLNVDTADIVNLAVETAKIANLHVTTGKIADDATRVYQNQSTTGSQNINYNGGYTTLQSLTETSLGGVVGLVASYTLHSTGGGTKTVTTQLLKGSTVLQEREDTVTDDGDEKTISFMISDIPGSGSVSYSIQAHSDVSGASGLNRTMIFDESKGK